ncbi:purine permease 3-like [Solanum dulcamara]|uniref:purine permease 3-like n=1 Tax=Solanum dulcamara TaxID=45834 RepID=UPI0024856CB9|nr:purine permease 3-like [Solanum dulcamara]
MTTQASSSRTKKFLLVINCIILAIGNCGGPLITRLYFIKGGKRIWLSSWLQTVAWPIILIPLAFSYFNRRREFQGKIFENNDNNNNNSKTKVILMTPWIFVSSIGIGVLIGFDNYLYAYGVAKLPVSTSALLIASQLAFTAGFAFLLVKQKFTSYSINSIFVLTLGAVVLALHANGDRPNGEPKKEYVLGFIMTLGAAALYGLILPLFELLYKKAKQGITYTLVLEIQAVYCLISTVVCTIGMIINKDFQAMSREAKSFELGEGRYYIVIIWSAIIWQCFFLGAIGVVYSSSSLVSGIVITVLLPITEILGVVFYGEKFTAEKGISLVLSIWGFISYLYGDIKASKVKTKNESQEQEMIDKIICTP